MIKKVISLAVAVVFGLNVVAQSVQETTASVGTLTVPAFQLTLDKDVKLVQNAMNQRLKDAKLKTKNSEGYVAVLEQMMTEISAEPVSLYTKVEEQGKKKDRVVVVTVCATTTNLTIDQVAMRGNVRAWLEAFVPYIARYEASMKMQDEQDNLKKAEKVAASAASALASLEKDISNDEKKIADKKDEIKKLQDKIKGLENDIKELEKNIDKNKGKKVDAEKAVSEANRAVEEKQADVERWRQQAQ